MTDRKTLEQKLQYTFQNKSLLDLALTHRSATIDSAVTSPGLTNERLEFLGDRVLGLSIADMLYAHYSDEPEGSMARRLATLVSRETLLIVAEELLLQDHIEVGGSEAETDTRTSSIAANACEAVIGAVYLDAGFGVARNLVERHWRPLMEAEITPPKDAKTELQEWAQGKGLPLPVYSLVERSGPAHAPVFTMSVLVDGHDAVIGTGSSKRVATQAAATTMLKSLS